MAVSPLSKLHVEALAPAFKQAGFKKRPVAWHRERSETIQVFEVQRSQWGNQFYWNLGVFVLALGRPLKLNACYAQLNFRVQHIIPPEMHAAIEKLHDFDTEVALNSRLAELVGFVEQFVLRWFNETSTLSGVQSVIHRLPSHLRTLEHQRALETRARGGA